MPTIRVAYKCCGQNFGDSDRTPVDTWSNQYPRDIKSGAIQKCPSHGVLPQNSVAVSAGARYACQKCGLVQNIINRSWQRKQKKFKICN